MHPSPGQGDSHSSYRVELLKQLLAKKGITTRRTPQIRKRTGPGPYPLSFAQHRLWFLYQLEPDSPNNNLFSGIRLTGELDKSALDETITQIVRRHETLRTTFTAIEGVPWQVINEAAEIRLPVIDLTAMDGEGRERELVRLATQESRRPFSLATGPLLRVTLARLASDQWAVLFTMPHIVSDGWSMGVLVREVTRLYEAIREGRGAELEELEVQYADYAAWQREWMSGEVMDEQVRYWRGQLEGAPPLLDLPADKPRPVAETFQGESHSLVVGLDLAKSLRALAEREGATLFMVLLAAFNTLLYRHTYQEDVIVGSPIANRNRGEIEGLIGFFVNTLVLRTDLSGNPTFRELLARVRQTTLGAYDHQDLPFDKIVEAINPERTSNAYPLFPVQFGLRNNVEQRLSLTDLAVSYIGTGEVTVRVDLGMEVFEMEDGLDVVFNYKTDLFNPDTMARMAGHFDNLLKSIVDDPDRPLSELRMMTHREVEQLVVEWNRTDADYDLSRCIHELFEDQVERAPESIAVIQAQEELTFAELDRMANNIARRLLDAGIGPEVRVGVYMERVPMALAAILGTLKAGAAYVPIDPAYPIERVQFIIEDAQVPLVLTQEHLADLLPAYWGQVICLDTDRDSLEQNGGQAVANTCRPENLAYVIYTSGSTGRPKGVMVTHRGLANYLNWSKQQYAAPGKKGSPVHSSLSFDLTVTSIFIPLLTGKSVTLISEDGLDRLSGALRSGDYSLLKITPAHLSALNQLIPVDQLARAAGAIVIGGEALLGHSVRHWQTHAPRTRLFNEYGPTETVVGCCVFEIPATAQISDAVPIGRPIGNTQLHVLDPFLNPVPVGVVGEIYIGGECLTRGYINRPDLTAERFLPDPVGRKAGARLYKTGDLARYLLDGNIEYFGRNDSQVKIRGFRIELGEVEAAISEHPAVRDAVVTLREDTPGQKRLAAYLVMKPESNVSVSDLRRFLGVKLPEYMVPSALVFIDELPLTTNGKVDRKRLPAPADVRAEIETGFVAPRTPVEDELAEIWRELLGVDRVGINDNFFELGGHSLLLTQLASRISNQFEIEIPLRVLFDTPTIVEMVRAIAELLIQQQDSADVTALLQRIKKLSPHEVRSLLETMSPMYVTAP